MPEAFFPGFEPPGRGDPPPFQVVPEPAGYGFVFLFIVVTILVLRRRGYFRREAVEYSHPGCPRSSSRLRKA